MVCVCSSAGSRRTIHTNVIYHDSVSTDDDVHTLISITTQQHHHARATHQSFFLLAVTFFSHHFSCECIFCSFQRSPLMCSVDYLSTSNSVRHHQWPEPVFVQAWLNDVQYIVLSWITLALILPFCLSAWQQSAQQQSAKMFTIQLLWTMKVASNTNAVLVTVRTSYATIVTPQLPSTNSRQGKKGSLYWLCLLPLEMCAWPSVPDRLPHLLYKESS